jgi:hypothetical protein
MGGGLLQLVAYGAQDAYISGNPQITFWKGLFKRHTNFAMEPFRINFSGQVQWGTKQTAMVGRHADLLYSTYVEVVLPKTIPAPAGWTGARNSDGTVDYYWNNDGSSLGYNLIRHVELDIGGQLIDRMYSEFMTIWGGLTSEYHQLVKLTNLLQGPCEGDGAARLAYGPGCATDGRQNKLNILYIPLPFFFTRNPGAALPLIALQYHEVKINVLWNEPQLIAGNFNNAAVGNNQPGIQFLPQAVQAALYIDYIYLDTEERRRMAQASHEYLIEQTQFNEDKGIRGANNRIDLTFNHPVKELIWVVQPAGYTDCRVAANNTRPYAYTTYVGTYNNEQQDSTSGGGSGAKFDFKFNKDGSVDVDLADPGSGYVVGETLTFNASSFGTGAIAYADGNFVLTVNTVTTGAITSFTVTSGTQRQVAVTRLRPFTYDVDPVFEQWLQINGQDRLDRRYGDYFNRVQPYQHHTGRLTPGGGVYMYSFALRPEEHQPSGTCNFSRIDTATIVMNMAGTSGEPGFGPNATDEGDWNVRVYAVNYNVLRVMSGMGGLAYSN